MSGQSHSGSEWAFEYALLVLHVANNTPQGRSIVNSVERLMTLVYANPSIRVPAIWTLTRPRSRTAGYAQGVKLDIIVYRSTNALYFTHLVKPVGVQVWA